MRAQPHLPASVAHPLQANTLLILEMRRGRPSRLKVLPLAKQPLKGKLSHQPQQHYQCRLDLLTVLLTTVGKLEENVKR